MKNYRLVFRAVDHDKFDEIAEGLKTIETRAATVKYRAVEAGDTLTFVCGKDSMTKAVTKVEHFDGLKQMFAHLPLGAILPSVKDFEEARKVYHSFPGYEEKIKENGIVAFTLQD